MSFGILKQSLLLEDNAVNFQIGLSLLDVFIVEHGANFPDCIIETLEILGSVILPKPCRFMTGEISENTILASTWPPCVLYGALRFISNIFLHFKSAGSGIFMLWSFDQISKTTQAIASIIRGIVALIDGFLFNLKQTQAVDEFFVHQNSLLAGSQGNDCACPTLVIFVLHLVEPKGNFYI